MVFRYFLVDSRLLWLKGAAAMGKVKVAPAPQPGPDDAGQDRAKVYPDRDLSEKLIVGTVGTKSR